jgi:hypothetical protein
MAESGTMITSGEYRNNSRNTGGGGAGGGGNLLAQAGQMISAHGEKKQAQAERLSAAQWTAAGQVAVARRQGKTAVKNKKLDNKNAAADREAQATSQQSAQEHERNLETLKGRNTRSKIRAKAATMAKLGDTFEPGSKVKHIQGKTSVEGTLKKTAKPPIQRKPRTTTPKGK